MMSTKGTAPDSKVRGANMGPIWGWQDPGGPHIGPMNFAVWGRMLYKMVIKGTYFAHLLPS